MIQPGVAMTRSGRAAREWLLQLQCPLLPLPLPLLMLLLSLLLLLLLSLLLMLLLPLPLLLLLASAGGQSPKTALLVATSPTW